MDSEDAVNESEAINRPRTSPSGPGDGAQYDEGSAGSAMHATVSAKADVAAASSDDDEGRLEQAEPASAVEEAAEGSDDASERDGVRESVSIPDTTTSAREVSEASAEHGIDLHIESNDDNGCEAANDATIPRAPPSDSVASSNREAEKLRAADEVDEVAERMPDCTEIAEPATLCIGDDMEVGEDVAMHDAGAGDVAGSEETSAQAAAGDVDVAMEDSLEETTAPAEDKPDKPDEKEPETTASGVGGLVDGRPTQDASDLAEKKGNGVMLPALEAEPESPRAQRTAPSAGSTGTPSKRSRGKARRAEPLETEAPDRAAHSPTQSSLAHAAVEPPTKRSKGAPGVSETTDARSENPAPSPMGADDSQSTGAKQDKRRREAVATVPSSPIPPTPKLETPSSGSAQKRSRSRLPPPTYEHIDPKLRRQLLLIASQDDPTFVAEREYREKEKEKEKEKEGEKEREKEVIKEKTPAKASDKSDMSVQPSPSILPSEREAAAKNRSRPKPKPRDKDSSKLKVDEVEIAAVRESGSKATVATSSKRMDKAVEPVLPAKEAAKESKTTTTMTTKELKVADVAKDSKTADVVAKDSSKDSKREPKRDAKAKEITAAPAKAKEASTAQSKAKEEEAASQSRVKEAPAQSKAKETTAAPAKAKEASTAQSKAKEEEAASQSKARPKEDTKAKEAADKEQQRAKEAAPPAHAKHPKEVAKQAHTAKPRGDEKPESKRSDRSAHGASASTRPEPQHSTAHVPERKADDGAKVADRPSDARTPSRSKDQRLPQTAVSTGSMDSHAHVASEHPSTDALNGSGKRQLASPAVTTAVAEPQAAAPPAPTDEACQKFWKKRFLTRYQTE